MIETRWMRHSWDDRNARGFLAAELNIRYACLAHVVNPAAGVAGKSISLDDMKNEIKRGAQNFLKILTQFLSND